MGLWNRKKVLEAGKAAPGFELKDPQGKLHASKDLLADAPALFAFFKVSCPVCQLALPFLERIHGGVPSGQLRIVGISQDYAEDTQGFSREFGITFTTLLDTTKSGYPVSDAFGITNVPTMFLVEQDGKISWTSTGFSRSDLEALGNRFGFTVFRQDDNVPAWKAG